MTEIDERFLARGKRVDNGEWIEGYYGECYNGKENVSCVSIPSRKAICGSLCYDVVPKTLGRYTGQKDKNGTKIFEGDILKVPNFSCHGKVIYEVPECHYIIEMSDGNWVPMHDFAGEVEVIGNIHDNPK